MCQMSAYQVYKYTTSGEASAEVSVNHLDNVRQWYERPADIEIADGSRQGQPAWPEPQGADTH